MVSTESFEFEKNYETLAVISGFNNFRKSEPRGS